MELSSIFFRNSLEAWFGGCYIVLNVSASSEPCGTSSIASRLLAGYKVGTDRREGFAKAYPRNVLSIGSQF